MIELQEDAREQARGTRESRRDLQHRDEQIVREAKAALVATGYRQLGDLQVYCDNGRVVLQGQLPTYYLKQVAQATIQGVGQVHDIDNDIRVRSH